MKVRELIQKLQACDPEALVFNVLVPECSCDHYTRSNSHLDGVARYYAEFEPDCFSITDPAVQGVVLYESFPYKTTPTPTEITAEIKQQRARDAEVEAEYEAEYAALLAANGGKEPPDRY